jgi:hypothetical protein
MSAYSILALLHAGLGTLALLAFWTAGLSRKGGPLHRAAGKLYLLAMSALLAVAVPMSGVVLVQRSQVGGAFLLYLLVITVTAVWLSWRAIRDKRDWARYTGPVYRGLMWLNLVSALAIAAIGLLLAKNMQLIIVAFAGIGLFSFVSMRRFARARPDDPRWWLREHLNAMLGNGVATHIAFLSIGLPKVLPMLAGPTLQNLAWLGPLVVAFVAGSYLTRKFLPKRPAPQGRGQAVAG